MKRAVVILSILGAIVVISLIIFTKNNTDTSTIISTTANATAFTGKEHFVVLTKDGFSPESITITQGDKITFSATRKYGKPFWPASNIHPTHRLYPEFDPKQPIDNDKTWSFIFNKVGVWRSHDHLAPYFTGTITVVKRVAK